MSSDRRLIEEWLPIAALGEESVRERRSMTALPPTYYLHVWWARRPLVASRAAILGCLLPADADREKFLHVVGIHGDPVASRRRIDFAKRSGERFEGEAYSYKRAFTYVPNEEEVAWIADSNGRTKQDLPTVLDPTAGGGSIPFESARLKCTTLANDLNPVAALIETATVSFPAKFGSKLVSEFEHLAARFVSTREERLSVDFPDEPEADCITTNYLYARTITCPYCEGLVPLSPNWKLTGDGAGIRLNPQTAGRRICTFEIVEKASQHSEGTVSDGDSRCPFPDCLRVIDGDEVKRQAQAGAMGEQLFTVVFKRKRITGYTKQGKEKVKWERGFRAPLQGDDNSEQIRERLADKTQEWEAFDLVPSETLPEISNYDRGHRLYGMYKWVDLFSPRQLLCHGTSVEIYREMLVADQKADQLTELREAAYIYLALSLDKLRDYNSRMTRWHSNREVVVNTFDRHDFSFKWSYVEMAPLIVGLGYDWAIEQTRKCIAELCELIRPDDASRTKAPTLTGMVPVSTYQPPPITITCKSGDTLDHLDDSSRWTSW